MGKVITIALLIITMICMIIGTILLIIQGIDREYVQNAEVLAIQGDKIIVRTGWENDDPIIYEIDKPTYKELKNGDTIHINNKNEVIRYDINRDLMLNIAVRLYVYSNDMYTFMYII